MDNNMSIGNQFFNTVNNIGSELNNFGDQSINYFNFFYDKCWVYVRDLSTVGRNSISLAGTQIGYPSEVLTPLVQKIRIVSSLAFVFMIRSTIQELENLFKNIKFQDPEGIVLSLFDGIRKAGSIVDEFYNTLNSLYIGYGVTAVSDIVQFMSPVAVPLALAILSHLAFRGVYNSIVHAIEFSDLPSQVDATTLKDLHAILQKKFGATEEEIARNRHILVRHTDAKIVKIMDNMLKSHDVNKVNAELDNIKALTLRKISLNLTTSASHVALVVALGASTYFGGPSIAVPAAGAARAAISIVAEVCQTNLDWGLVS